VRDAITRRLRERHDIDLIIAMGTWAGQDMAALGAPVPTIVASTSDAVGAHIVASAEDSGLENLHARVQPERYQHQVRLFHEIVPFKALGLVYEDSLFHAETIARVFNGAKPRQLSQIWVDPAKIALNLDTARRIGFDPPVDILLAADEVYEDK